MLICREENCTCLQHRILDCLETGLNLEAKIVLDKLKNICELRDTSGLTLLHYLVECGNAEIMQHLIDKGYNVNSQDRSGSTPLMLAVEAIDQKVVEILIKNNADIYLTDNEGKNSLELAFISRFYSTPSQLLLKQNSQLILDMLIEKINDDFSNGRFLKFLLNTNHLVKLIVVVFGSVEVTKFTLENGYPIDFYEFKYGRTALHYAIMLIKFENARILIDHGANVNALDNSSFTPLRYYRGDFEDVDENSEVLTNLLSYSIDLSTIDPSGFTDVERLLVFGKEQSVRAILESGIDVDACLNEDSSLLHRLVANKNISNLDFLNQLKYTKYDVNKNDADRYTPLMKAVFDGCHPEKVKFLLHQGADVNLMKSNGDTIVYSKLLERTRGNSEKDRDAAKVIALLLQYGVDIELFYRNRSHLLNDLSLTTHVIVAHWALMWTLEQSSLSDKSRSLMKSKSRLKTYFDGCILLLEEMKSFKVYGTMTLFTLLTDREENFIALYARNQVFLSSFCSVMENLLCFKIYYVNTLLRRLVKYLDEAVFQEKVSLTIETLTGLCSNMYYAIVWKIVGYLDRQDLCNLCKVVR